LLRDGQAVSYQTKIIKGVSYIVFEARSGQYEVHYSDYGQAASQSDDNTEFVKSGTLAMYQSADAPVADQVTEDKTATAQSHKGTMSVDNKHDYLSQLPSHIPWYSQPTVWVVGTGVAIAVTGTSWGLVSVRRRLR
jgi:hypothetical protein